ncbi:MAG: inositol monophosphatase family protein [Myxococcota bacterium]
MFEARRTVACRLALTAVAEGEAAVSLAGTAHYDFAATHTIVQGAGALVLDLEGRSLNTRPQAVRESVLEGCLSEAVPMSFRTSSRSPGP